MELRSAHFPSTVKQSTELKPGDVVLFNEDKQPKNLWKMRRIKDIYLG